MLRRAADLLAQLFRPALPPIDARRSPYDKSRSHLTPTPDRHGARETERRCRAIAAGRITRANGLAS